MGVVDVVVRITISSGLNELTVPELFVVVVVVVVVVLFCWTSSAKTLGAYRATLSRVRPQSVMRACFFMASSLVVARRAVCARVGDPTAIDVPRKSSGAPQPSDARARRSSCRFFKGARRGLPAVQLGQHLVREQPDALLGQLYRHPAVVADQRELEVAEQLRAPAQLL